MMCESVSTSNNGMCVPSFCASWMLIRSHAKTKPIRQDAKPPQPIVKPSVPFVNADPFFAGLLEGLRPETCGLRSIADFGSQAGLKPPVARKS